MKVSTRNGGIAGIVAGLGYLVQAVIVLIPKTDIFSRTLNTVIDVIVIIALVATILSLMGLHSFAQKPLRHSRSDRLMACSHWHGFDDDHYNCSTLRRRKLSWFWLPR